MLSHRNPAYLPEGNAITAEGEMRGARDSLPAIWCPRDLALLIILIIVFVSDLRGMQFAGNAIFFYWGLAFVTLQVPSLYVLSWLTHQAPRRAPIAIWLLHFVPERLRSVLFFLLWWCFNLVMLAALGACFTFLQAPLAPWSGIPAVQYLAFILLLGGATLLLMLPARLFKAALWIGGLCYLTAFALIVLAAVVFLIGHHQATGTLPLPTLTFFPAHFSWALFGLALLSLIGLNAPLLLDGEMRGPQRFLRGSAGYLYWGGLGSFGLILMLTAAWVLVKEVTPIEGAPSLAFIAPALGSWALPVTWLLLFLGSFGGVLAYLLLFSRAFLLAARRGFLPRSFTRLTPSGIPRRAILVQSVLILCTAVVFFILTPAVLGLLFPKDLVNTFTTGDPFSLLTSITGALWCLFTTLIFVFACWLFFKKRRRSQMGRLAWLLPGLCLLGIVSSLCCALAPFLPTWPALFFSRNRWFPLVVIGLGCSLALAWMMGELPRRAALLRERQKHLEHEKQLRAEVQRLYTHEHDLNQQLNNAYERQRLLLLKQRSLLDEVNRLYHEQEQAARIDAVTGLLNHRAIRERLAEEIEQCCTHAGSFLLFFLDLDHFKNINDTWGHLAGDTILRELAERLRAMLRPEDAAGRYGGEEFLVIKSATPFAEARQEGERLQTSMRAAPWIWQGSGCSPIEIPVTVSIGVAAYGIHGTQPDELIAQADLAMYQAKLAGRNCLRLADRPFLLSGLPS